jgi:TMEM175 potassium channel family protein
MPTATVPTRQSPQLSVSKHRMEALSDGVFAIVMTLLVLELKIPELARNVSVGELGRALAHEGPVFFSFAVTFMFASLFWYLHHVLLNFLTEFPRKLIVLNLAFLLFVSLLPFSVGVQGHFLRNPLAQTIYFSNQFGIATFLFIQWRIAHRASVVIDPTGRDARSFNVRLIALSVGTLLAIAVAWANSIFSYYAFMIVMVLSRAYTTRKYGKN